jgi:hypothetical protein
MTGRKLSLPSPSAASQPAVIRVLAQPVIELDHDALQGIRDTLDQIEP